MNPFQVIYLVCSLAMPRGDCQMSNAQSFQHGPAVANELACIHDGWVHLAQNPIVIREGEWVKVSCRRTTIGQENVG
jgi:hypothetical protein